MKDRLSISFKITRSVISSLKSLPGLGEVSYNEVYLIYGDVMERLTGYREPFAEKSILDKKSLDKVESEVRSELGEYLDSETDEGLHKMQMFVMETVSQAETISRMQEDIDEEVDA